MGTLLGTMSYLIGKWRDLISLPLDFFSAIPIIGWVGDAFYRANLKNIEELRRHLLNLDGLQASVPLQQGR